MITFAEWAKMRLAEIEAEKKDIPTGDPRQKGYRMSYNLCKYHGIDVTVVSKAVRDGHIDGYIAGNHLWVNRDDFREFFDL